MIDIFTPLHQRYWTAQPDRSVKRGKPTRALPNTLLTLDVETTTDMYQELLFGRARLIHRVKNGNDWFVESEYIFYPDNATPDRIAHLRDCARLQYYGRNYITSDPPYTPTKMLSVSDFIEQVLYKNAMRTTNQAETAFIVGANLPFDMSRLALKWGKARGGITDGGFSLLFWTHPDGKPNRYRPRLRIRLGEAGVTFFSWSRTSAHQNGQRYRVAWKDNMLDVLTLARALTGIPQSLNSAAKLFLGEEKTSIEEHGVITAEYVAYNRHDVLLTQRLALKLLEETYRHPIPNPTKVFSTASVGKSYLTEMGLKTPPMVTKGIPEDADKLNGFIMSTYYGGRTETRIRKRLVPIVDLDFTSMYPTVHTLLNLWALRRARQVLAFDATDAVQELLAAVDAEALYDQNIWPRLNVLVMVKSDGDVLPVRGEYTRDQLKIGLNVLSADFGVWYALPDVIASKLLTGKAPAVLRAIGFRPEDTQTLRQVSFAGRIKINPNRADFFKLVIEERLRIKDEVKRRERGEAGNTAYNDVTDDGLQSTIWALKILANSCCYGVCAETNVVNRSEAVEQVAWTAAGAIPFTSNSLEQAGRYNFPLVATLITSGARLLLSLLECEVTRAGGVFAFTDTDSMAVVASETGGVLSLDARGANGEPYQQSIPVLKWEQVKNIYQRFVDLNPYGVVSDKSILTPVDVNYVDGQQAPLEVLALSSKRYALVRDGKVIDARESGFGGIIHPTQSRVNPVALATDFYNCMLTDRDGRSFANIPYLHQPLVRQRRVTSPTVAQWFTADVQRRLRPFTFMLESAAFAGDFNARTVAVNAPFEKDVGRWDKTDWYERETGRLITIRIPDAIPAFEDRHKPRFKAVGNYLTEYVIHPETCFAGPDGKLCAGDTTGMLDRVHVRATSIKHIDKGADAVDDEDGESTATPRIIDNSETDAMVDRLLPNVPTPFLARFIKVSERLVRKHKQTGIPDLYRDRYRRAVTVWVEEEIRKVKNTSQLHPVALRSLVALREYAGWCGNISRVLDNDAALHAFSEVVGKRASWVKRDLSGSKNVYYGAKLPNRFGFTGTAGFLMFLHDHEDVLHDIPSPLGNPTRDVRPRG